MANQKKGAAYPSKTRFVLAVTGWQSGGSGDHERLKTHQAAPTTRIRLMGSVISDKEGVFICGFQADDWLA